VEQEEPTKEQVVAQAAEAAAEATANAIDDAAELNDDPAVAEALDRASAEAQRATHRVSWLRRFLDRFRHHPAG
jgi:hypothetical protein